MSWEKRVRKNIKANPLFCINCNILMCFKGEDKFKIWFQCPKCGIRKSAYFVPSLEKIILDSMDVIFPDEQRIEEKTSGQRKKREYKIFPSLDNT